MQDRANQTANEATQALKSILTLKTLQVIVVKAQALVKTKIMAEREAKARVQLVAEVTELLKTVSHLIATGIIVRGVAMSMGNNCLAKGQRCRQCCGYNPFGQMRKKQSSSQAKGQCCRQCGGRNPGQMHKKQSSIVNLVHEPQADAEHWLDAATVTVQEDCKAWTVELDLQGKMLEFKVDDTGADVTILKETDFKRLPR